MLPRCRSGTSAVAGAGAGAGAGTGYALRSRSVPVLVKSASSDIPGLVSFRCAVVLVARGRGGPGGVPVRTPV